MYTLKKYLSNMPLIALVAANTVPLWGVLFLDWDAFHLVLLYWAESLIIGFYSILKIALAKAPNLVAHLSKLFSISLFVVHFGGFMAVHALVVLAIFNKNKEGYPVVGRQLWPWLLAGVQFLLTLIKYMYSIIPANMKYALAALFISHGISFVYNYLLKGEFAASKPDKLMFAPYSRVVIMHIAIMVWAVFAIAIRETVAVLLALVVLKTVLDVKLHLRERRRKQKFLQAANTTPAS